MSGVALQVRLDDHQARALFDRLEAVDRTAVMTEIGEHLVSTTVARFRAQSGPDGTPWLPSGRALSDTGRARERGKRGRGMTLIDQGHLRQSITYRASHDDVEVGSNLVYAAIHQFGGDAGRGQSVHLPARPFLGITGDDRAEIDDIVAAHIKRALR